MQRYKNIKGLRVIINMKVLLKENLCVDSIILTFVSLFGGYNIDEKLTSLLPTPIKSGEGRQVN
ncbi:MAG: hypothetical protein ISS81_08590 [Candidatus Marinimicrobia bacterium]|nr:hypothetical protein [Candidatus Neomarinimicrobiota bacterium]